jgi:hypothetical protein
MAGCGPRSKYMRVTRSTIDPNSFEMVYAEVNGGFLTNDRAENIEIRTLPDGERYIIIGELEIDVDADAVRGITEGVLQGIKGI